MDYATQTGSVCGQNLNDTSVIKNAFDSIDLCSGTTGTFMKLEFDCQA